MKKVKIILCTPTNEIEKEMNLDIKIGDEIYGRWNNTMQWTMCIFNGETANGFEAFDFTIQQAKYIEYYCEITKNPYKLNAEIFQSNNWKDRNYKNYHFTN